MTRDILLVTGLLLAWPAATAAQHAIVVDDAHVSLSAQRRNRSFGDGDSLQVSPLERAFLRFSLNLPAGTPGSHVGQATLKVFVRNVRTPGEVRLHRVSGAWSEDDVTANLAPAIGAQEGAPVVITQAHERNWVTVDITQLARDWLDNALVNDGVALVGLGATDVVLDSKENVATSHEPVLEILLNHATTTDDAARLGGVAAAEYTRTTDSRLSDARTPTPDSNHYIQNTPNPQDARFNVADGMVRGNLTVLGALNAPNFNVAGSFIQNQTTQPQAGASFNIAGDGTVGGTLSGGIVNAAAQFNLLGSRVLAADFGGNLFAGMGAGRVNTSGFLNAFVGADAGVSNTEGCCNSFFGNRAGAANTTGSANAFVGGLAGGVNTEGIRNAFFGDLAGFDMDLSFAGLGPGTNTGVTTGSFNTFLGSRSGLRITEGSNNTFVGYNTIGAPHLSYGTAIGSGATVTTDNTIVLGRSLDTVVVPGALSLNIVDAATQFNLGGQHVLRSTPDSTVTVGLGAGSPNPGVHNTFVGGHAGASNTGFSNVFVGWNAGAQNGNGHFNTFVGAWAGRENTSGADNSFFGDGTGSSNSTGSNNSYFGADAGRGCDLGFKVPCVTVTTAANNSFFGAYAGRKTAAGGDNAYFGYRAGYHNVSSSFNSFFGSYAGENTTSSYNAFFGSQAGRLNTTGERNAFFGTEAGSHNVDGYNNVFVGVLAGVFNTSGVWNTFVGTHAGSNNQGSHNAFFGTNAGLANVTGNHNSFFGRNAGYSNAASGNAFFGAGAGELTTTGARNVFLGTGSGSLNIGGNDNTFVGENAGRGNVSGNHNTLLGWQAEVGAGDLGFATAIGAGSVVNASDTVVLGRAVDTVRIPGSLLIAGTFAAAGFTGNGAGLTSLDAGNIASGTLANARLGLIPTANIADAAVTAPKIAAGQVVKNLNGLTDAVTLTPGANVTITPSGNTLTIAAAGGSVNAILNQTTVQAGANFNISGTGTARALNVLTEYDLSGSRILAAPGFDNLFAGIGAGQATTASAGFNAFFGAGAGASNLAGNSNSFFGARAGLSTTGPNNSFFGAQAGEQVTTGIGNSYFGDQAGQFNDVGSSNSFFGRRSGYRNKANGNSFFGHDAGRENTIGMRNSYFGVAAGQNYPEGSNNSIFGYDAGAGFSRAASANSFFGAAAGLGNSGDQNAFFGWEAGRENFAGSGNTFVGAQAGRSNGAANNNTFIGFQAAGLPGVTNATAIGANAVAGQSNALVLGRDLDVGIGTSTPRARLDVQGGDILVGSPGQGLILKSPNGGTCLRLTVTDAGTLEQMVVACPM